MNTHQRLHLRIYPYNQRTKKGLTPIYVRISIDGKRAELSTSHKIQLRHWDKARMRLKPGAPNEFLINSNLNAIRNKLNKLFVLTLASEKQITPKELKDKYLGVDEKANLKTLCDAFDYHNQKMEEKVKTGLVSPATLLKYSITKDKVVAFMKFRYRKEDRPLEELKFKFVTEFEHYLLTKENLKSNTAYKYIKNLKRVLNIAVGLEWVPTNPFAQFKCSYRSPDRVVLTQSEIDRLQNTEIKITRLAEVRDVFIFCCYTGFAYSEVHKLNKNDLSIGIDGETWLTTFRKKSGERESLPLLPIALEIVERYKDHEYCSQYEKLLPVNSNQRYNAYLKELADLCGNEKKLTTHIARHTFATTVTLSNDVPIETVSKMLGHTKLATTQIYAKVLDRKVSKDMRVLREKLSPTEEKLKKISRT